MTEIDELIDAARVHLDRHEVVQSAVLGLYENPKTSSDTSRLGVLMATNRRVIFYSRNPKGSQFECFPYSDIGGVSHTIGVIGDLSFLADGTKVRLKWVEAGKVEGFASSVRSHIGEITA